MIAGTVTADGNPVIRLAVSGKDWNASIDTGFNGGLQLPEACRSALQLDYIGRATWVLANDQRIEEDTFAVQVAFDGEQVSALASFIQGDEILNGTHFLRHHRLTIDFAARQLTLEKSLAENQPN